MSYLNEAEHENLRLLREAALLASAPKPGHSLIGFYGFLAWLPDDDNDGSAEPVAESLAWIAAPTTAPSDPLWRELLEAVIESCEGAIAEMDER